MAGKKKPARSPSKPVCGFGEFGYRFDAQGRLVDESGALLDVRGSAMVEAEEGGEWDETEWEPIGKAKDAK